MNENQKKAMLMLMKEMLANSKRIDEIERRVNELPNTDNRRRPLGFNSTAQQEAEKGLSKLKEFQDLIFSE